MPGTDDFEIWRATERDGRYVNISGPIHGTRYSDTSVAMGQSYYYSIVAPVSANIRSVSNCARLSPYASSFDRVIATHSTPASALCVALNGSYAYLTVQYYPIRVLDVSNPSSPTLVNTYDTSSFGAYDWVIEGTLGYVGAFEAGLLVLDLRDPDAPSSLGAFAGCDWALGVAKSGNYVCVANHQKGVFVIDVTNPALPSQAALYNTPDLAMDVEVSGSYAYVADARTGLLILDISVPSSPVFQGQCDTPGEAYDVALRGS